LAYKRVLIPLDGSSLSEATLPHAKSPAQSLGTESVLIRVTGNLIAGYVFSNSDLAENTSLGIEPKSEDYIKALSTSLEDKGFRVSYPVRKGLVTEIIPRVADAMQMDSIAMSTHVR